MLELGFMSNATDRANMQSPEWRARGLRQVY
jgi:N-acetylmuramoyl-L-alanine amidase